MALFTEFDYDIFISYAHRDNQVAPGQKMGWVTGLRKCLMIDLGERFGVDLNIWMDMQRIEPTDKIPQTLANSVTNSAILLSVFSPSYLNSSWCKKELHDFYEIAERRGSLHVQDKMSIIKVVKHPLKADDYPPEIPPAVANDLFGFDLYEIDPQTEKALELKPEIDWKFNRKVESLSNGIQVLIKQLMIHWRIQSHARTYSLPQSTRGIEISPVMTGPIPTPIAGPGVNGKLHEPEKTVYLALTTRDRNGNREDIESELKQHGYRVLPEKGSEREMIINAEAPQIEAQVREWLQQSHISVHLIGERYGTIPEMGWGRSLTLIQYELAIERKNEDPEFSQIIWIPQGLNTIEGQQGDFIESLRNDSNLRERDELLETNIEDVKTTIHVKLRPKLIPKLALDDQGEDQIVIYLIFDKRDSQEVTALEEYLVQKDFIVLKTPFDAPPDSFQDRDKESLLNCDAVVIYYGNTDEQWAKLNGVRVDKVRTIHKIPKPLKAFYISPPPTEQKARFIYPNTWMIRSENGLNCVELDILINRIKGTRGGTI